MIWKGPHYNQCLADQQTDASLGLKIKIEQTLDIGFHFLDLYVETENGKYITKIFQKPTYSPVLILCWSDDPFYYKWQYLDICSKASVPISL